MATDCTAAADADVYFPQYAGINLQFNGFMYASYGGGWTMDRDGQNRSYGMTWMAPWADFGTYAHEEGHTFWLPHSSGPYGAVYDSRWDVMSNWGPFFDAAENTNIPTHTIAYHKSLLGWLRPDQLFVAPPESRQSIMLERLARPGTRNYLLALIPLTGTDQTVQYSVEARRQVGRYDAHVPGNAVVIHEVDQRRDVRAHVVDPDNNGDPNDAGAQWTVGETFTDAANGITVRVDSMILTGFGITITRTATRWTVRAPLPTPRLTFALGAVGGLLYAVGGIGDGPALRSVHVYDPTTNAWTARAAMPVARYDLDGAVTIDGLLSVPGGRNSSRVLTKTLYVYDPSTNSWSTRAPMPIASGCGGAGAIGGLLYVLTGCIAGGFTGRLHRFTPSTNTWTARATAPVAHGFPAVGVINGRLYVAGGRNAAGAVTARLDVYDPATNTWSRLAGMPAPRFGAAGRVIKGKLYVVGGNDGQAPVATTFVYDPVANRWSSAPPMPAARTRLGAASAGGLLYAVGGSRDGNALDVVESFSP